MVTRDSVAAIPRAAPLTVTASTRTDARRTERDLMATSPSGRRRAIHAPLGERPVRKRLSDAAAPVKRGSAQTMRSLFDDLDPRRRSEQARDLHDVGPGHPRASKPLDAPQTVELTGAQLAAVERGRLDARAHKRRALEEDRRHGRAVEVGLVQAAFAEGDTLERR